MNRSIFTLILCLVGSMLALDAHAGITRACQAHFEIGINGSKLALGRFETRRGCGSSVPNRCRRRARDQAHACMAKFFKSGNKVPNDCLGSAVKNFPKAWKALGPKTAALVEAKSIAELINGIKKNPKYGYTVDAVTTGNTGCPKRVRLAQGNTKTPLPAGLFSVKEKVEAYKTTAKKRKKIISTVTVKVPKWKKKIVRSNFAPLKQYAIIQNPGHAYNGCGRHAAFHMLHWAGEKLSFTKKVSPAIPLIKNLFNKKERKAVSPGSLRHGLSKLLKAQKTGLTAKRMNRVTNPQAFMRNTIRYTSPIIALVENGNHYVTAMGYWAPSLEKHDRGYFYTFSNGQMTEKFEPSHYYNLKFSVAKKTLQWAVKTYRPGTMIYVVPEK